MIDKIKKTWYNVKKRVKERLPCGKKKQKNLFLRLGNFLLTLQLFILFCTSSILSLTASAYSQDEFLDDIETAATIYGYIETIQKGGDYIYSFTGDRNAVIAYYTCIVAAEYMLANPTLSAGEMEQSSNNISGFFNYDGKTYIGTLFPVPDYIETNTDSYTSLGRVFSSSLFTLDFYVKSNDKDKTLKTNFQVTPYNNTLTYRIQLMKEPFDDKLRSTLFYDFSDVFNDITWSSGNYIYDDTTSFVYSNLTIPDITSYTASNFIHGYNVLGGGSKPDFPVGQPLPYDDIRNAGTDAERSAIVDNYITTVLNPYYIDKEPSIEPYLYNPPQPEPTEPTEPSIYDPDNEPSDLFGWLRLIVQAIISLISGIVRPVVNAINAVFSAISDGFAAILAFLGGLFTPDISIIQTEIDFIQAKFAFVGQIKLFVNDFMTVLTGYDGSPPDVITVDFDNSNTGFLSNVVGKAVLIDLSWFTPYRLTVHAILSAMLWVFYLWRLFHQLPAVVAGQAAVEHMAEDAAKNP